VLLISLAVVAIAAGCVGSEESSATEEQNAPDSSHAWRVQERHLANVTQLTFGGQNAEAYFSREADQLIYQATIDDRECDQIYIMNRDGSNKRMVSTGKGVTTCSFIAPDGERIIYASTHEADSTCPPRPDMSRGYVWALYPGFDIFSANPDGSDLKNLTGSPRYDAEGVYSPDGSKIVFTSLRSGDLELYSMNPDGSDVQQLTNELGYDGGAFFSYDGSKIIYRASRPQTGEDSTDYVSLLVQDLIRPSALEIWIMDADGGNKRQITNLGHANFAPYLHPDGTRLVFCSNHETGGRNFDLYLINVDGTGLERLTYNPTFDGFPMWSHDGKKFVFCSNRDNAIEGETNVFIADWVD
jgi:Tol biopolymer transport system component